MNNLTFKNYTFWRFNMSSILSILLLLYFGTYTTKAANETDTDNNFWVSTSIPIGSTISLKGNNGKYVSSENGRKPMTCNKKNQGSWEKFKVVNAGNGYIALKASNGKYVSYKNANKPMKSDASKINRYTKFKVKYHGNGRISLKGTNGKFVSSENGKQPIRCNRNNSGPWEKFKFKILTPHGGNNSTIRPPSNPTCVTGNFIWKNNINVNNLSGSNGIPQTDVRFREATFDNPINFTQYRIPGPYPSEFAGPVAVSIDQVVSWDGYLKRAGTGNQPKEQWKIVFLKDGIEMYSTRYTQDLVTGKKSAEWIGALDQNISLPNGTDEIILVHYEDDKFGDGNAPSGNSVVPVSICISYEPSQPVCTLEVTASPDQEICKGEEVTLTATVDGNETCDDCIEYSIKNTDRCDGNQNYVMWLSKGNNPRFYSNIDLVWKELPNGTAKLTGKVFDSRNARKIYKVEAIYSGKTSNAPQGSPKNHQCNYENSADWIYYTQLTGTITKIDGTESFTISRRGPAFQKGHGANESEKEKGKLGASGWFRAANATNVKGDFNINFGECITSGINNSSFLWSTGETTESIIVSPTEDTTYSVTVTNCEDCTATDEVIVTVKEASVNLGDDQEICKGEDVTLTAEGVGTFVWSTGETTQSITVSPTETTTYSVTATEGNCTATDEVIVTVKEASVSLGEDQTICLGDEITLTSTPADTYLWSTGETTQSITVSPTAAVTWYKITVTIDGCTATDMIDIFVESVDVQVEDQEICLGEEVTLTAEGVGTFVWSTGETTQSITVSPTETTTYSVTATQGGCSATDDATVTVKEVSVSLGEDQTICLGDEITLTSTPADTYLWSTGETTQSITVSPTAAVTWYKITVTIDGCTATDMIDVFVESVDVQVEDQEICLGEEVTLTAEGAGTFVWSTGETTQSITVSPTETTTYSVTATQGGCSATDDATVTVKEASVSLGEDQTICLGDEITLTSTPADTYLWSTGETTQSITVSPTAAVTWYKITVTIDGCTATDMIDIFVESVDVQVEDQEICLGEEVTLTAEGAGTFVWSTGETTQSIMVSPTETTTYSVTATQGGCSATDDATVTVKEASVSLGEDQTICLGDEITLTSTPADTYLWSTGETTQSITVSPTAAVTWYKITVTIDGCTATDMIDIFVESVDVQVEDQEICLGEEVTLTAEGAGTFVWSTGETTQSITVSPTETTTYSVTATQGGCSATDDATVTVKEASVSLGEDQTICLGDEITLTSTPADTYLWSTGETTQSITVSPTAAVTWYKITVAIDGCTATDMIDIFVESVDVQVEDQEICLGEEVTLTAEGAGTFVWSTGETTQSITVSPTETTTYSVTATQGGCSATDDATVTVKEASVSLGEDQTICLGDEITLTSTPADTYLWSTGETTQSITVSPRADVTWYKITVTIDGCTATDMIDVFVESVDVQVEDQEICLGEEVTLTAEGAGTFVWSTGETTQSITVSPTETTTYSVTATQGGCSATDDATVTVKEVSVSLGEDQTICLGDEITLTSTPADTYLWSTGETTQSITVSPTAAVTWYKITVTIDGCTATDMIDIFVESVDVDAGEDQTIILGETAILTAVSDANNYNWSNGEHTASISVSPTETTTYTVMTTKNGCTAIDEVTVYVEIDPCVSKKYEVTATPIPVYHAGVMTIDVAVDETQIISYEVYKIDGNRTGPIVDLHIDKGCNTFSIDLDKHCNLQPTTQYVLKVHGNGWSKSIQFMTE